jgi:hypothetical protein
VKLKPNSSLVKVGKETIDNLNSVIGLAKAQEQADITYNTGNLR